MIVHAFEDTLDRGLQKEGQVVVGLSQARRAMHVLTK